MIARRFRVISPASDKYRAAYPVCKGVRRMDFIELLRNLILLVGFIGSTGGFPEQLPPAEEARCIRLLKDGDAAAREKLITHNLRLVAHIAKKYIKYGRDSDDLISIGTIGLIKAVSTFDPVKGVPLSSYASRCIENEILMSIRQEKKQVLSVSIDEAIGVDGDGNDISFTDILGTDAAIVSNSAEAHIENERLRVLIDESLPAREKRVILLRYGLLTGRPLTQRETAKHIGISRSYISRIEKRALKKLYERMKNGRET